jgi:[ribosomal protein S5]-alanine N-acetyltransferase
MYKYEDHLESSRLRTRFLTKDDISAWRVFFTEPEAVEYFPTVFLEPGADHSAKWINRQLERYSRKAYGLQALTDKNTGQFVGQCGLLLQTVDDIEEIEVGYHIFREFWGMGYATEAARLFLDYAFDNHLAPSVISIIDVRNLRSQRVAEKNGLQKEKYTTWNEAKMIVYRLHQS